MISRNFFKFSSISRLSGCALRTQASEFLNPHPLLEENRTIHDLRAFKGMMTKGYPSDVKPEPTPRGMSGSETTAIIPMSDPAFRAGYVTAGYHVRFGRVLEDLDTLAVCTCYKHNEPLRDWKTNTSPVGVVTAMVDELDIHKYRLCPETDIKIVGKVSHTGSSSMEVFMEVYQGDDLAMEAVFIMVATDPKTGRGTKICPVMAENDEEAEMIADAEARKRKRMIEAKMNLFKNPPSEEEGVDIYNKFIESLCDKSQDFNNRSLQPGQMWMENCTLRSATTAMPEYKNIHGKLFGGHIMRKSFELAYANARLVAGVPLAPVAVDDITFKSTVPIGAIFIINSQVSYSSADSCVCRVYSQVADPDTGKFVTTNTFYYQFKSLNGENIPEVIPRTYGESLLWTDCKRRFVPWSEAEHAHHMHKKN